MSKVYVINATILVKAQSLEAALKKVESIKRVKKFNVIKLKYGGMIKR